MGGIDRRAPVVVEIACGNCGSPSMRSHTWIFPRTCRADALDAGGCEGLVRKRPSRMVLHDASSGGRLGHFPLRQPGYGVAVESARAVLPERIDGDGLLLRRWRVSDAEALGRALDENDDHLRPWMAWMADEPR